ncbi:putative acidic repeat-containing protein-like, partial [Scophthalmus maximus]
MTSRGQEGALQHRTNILLRSWSIRPQWNWQLPTVNICTGLGPMVRRLSTYAQRQLCGRFFYHHPYNDGKAIRHCDECEKCPCEEGDKSEICDHCKMCSFCHVCAVCQTVCQPGGFLDEVTGSIY